MTSGLIIFAKNKHCAKVFGELFKEHKIEKYYLAISEKKPIKKQGLVKGDMAKSRRGMFKLLRTMNNPAITQFFSYSLGDSQRLYLLKPHSGKTHQIRVALNSIGVPIHGDSLYTAQQKTESLSEIDRGYLHAYALKFEIFEKKYEFILPPNEGVLFLGERFVNTLEEIKRPWLLNWPKLK
jgi:tRNA pseudouridine32 synthase/23S rRNA pseudouridine746 synthase